MLGVYWLWLLLVEINFILSVLLVAQIQSTIMRQSFVTIVTMGKNKVCQVFTFGFSQQCRVNAEFLLLHQNVVGITAVRGLFLQFGVK